MAKSKINKELKNILVIATQLSMQEIVGLPLGQWGYRVIPMTIEEFHRRWPDPNRCIDWILNNIHRDKLAIDGVIGTTDDASLMTAIIGQKAKLQGPSIAAVLNCQQKYWSRQIQNKVVREQTPVFALATSSNPPFPLPIFIKPVKSRLSYFSYLAANEQEYKRLVKLWHTREVVNRKANSTFIKLFNTLPAKLRKNEPFQNDLIAEEYIDAPDQITVDGYVYKGAVSFFGMTQSDFIPGTLSFNGFHYPYYQNNPQFKRRIERIVRTLIEGLKLDNTLFNVELKCNSSTGEVWIIEINSRMSQQFMYLIESVTGYHPFHAALDIAVGKRPMMRAASTIKRNNCCSCFILRRTQDAIVGRVPSPDEIKRIERKFRGVRTNVFVNVGERLSHHLGDSFTHRYGEVKIPGNSEQETRSIYKKIYKQTELLFRWC